MSRSNHLLGIFWDICSLVSVNLYFILSEVRSLRCCPRLQCLGTLVRADW